MLVVVMPSAFAVPAELLKARAQALQALQGFNPASVLKDYTTTPIEATLIPNETNNTIAAQGLNASQKRGEVSDVMRQALSVEKIIPNFKSPEMRFAEHLLAVEHLNVESTCAQENCDLSQTERSEDWQEGITRLSALVGAAKDVAEHQIKSGMPGVFKGAAQVCKKSLLGFRDCCSDRGWGDWIKQCPAELQALQKAKREQRVIYLGHYKPHRLSDSHYSYCVFPTQLAAIVQIQGRGGQLKVSFGQAKQPNCRGLTPEELSRIQFDRLDFSPLHAELSHRMKRPDDLNVAEKNRAHIEALQRQGHAHD